jgi:hypothetical protein
MDNGEFSEARGGQEAAEARPNYGELFTTRTETVLTPVGKKWAAGLWEKITQQAEERAVFRVGSGELGEAAEGQLQGLKDNPEIPQQLAELAKRSMEARIGRVKNQEVQESLRATNSPWKEVYGAAVVTGGTEPATFASMVIKLRKQAEKQANRLIRSGQMETDEVRAYVSRTEQAVARGVGEELGQRPGDDTRSINQLVTSEWEEVRRLNMAEINERIAEVKEENLPEPKEPTLAESVKGYLNHLKEVVKTPAFQVKALRAFAVVAGIALGYAGWNWGEGHEGSGQQLDSNDGQTGFSPMGPDFGDVHSVHIEGVDRNFGGYEVGQLAHGNYMGEATIGGVPTVSENGFAQEAGVWFQELKENPALGMDNRMANQLFMPLHGDFNELNLSRDFDLKDAVHPEGQGLGFTPQEINHVIDLNGAEHTAEMNNGQAFITGSDGLERGLFLVNIQDADTGVGEITDAYLRVKGLDPNLPENQGIRQQIFGNILQQQLGLTATGGETGHGQFDLGTDFQGHVTVLGQEIGGVQHENVAGVNFGKDANIPNEELETLHNQDSDNRVVIAVVIDPKAAVDAGMKVTGYTLGNTPDTLNPNDPTGWGARLSDEGKGAGEKVAVDGYRLIPVGFQAQIREETGVTIGGPEPPIVPPEPPIVPPEPPGPKEKGNRGHGNNLDGQDDDNPGKGGGGPNGEPKNPPDEDEGENGNQGDTTPGVNGGGNGGNNGGGNGNGNGNGG